jgi:hypothetical protein
MDTSRGPLSWLKRRLGVRNLTMKRRLNNKMDMDNVNKINHSAGWVNIRF